MLQLLPMALVIQQLDDGKFQPHFTTLQIIANTVRPPVFPFITQYSQTHHRPVVTSIKPVMVNIHTLGEFAVHLPLNFDMDQHPGFAAVLAPDLHQFVHQSPACFCVTDDLLKFLVKKVIPFFPIYQGNRAMPKNPYKSMQSMSHITLI